MKKSLIFIFRTLFIILFPGLLNAQIVISTDYPSNIKSGESFMLSVRVENAPNKGNAKLQLELPAGFSAKNVNSRRSDFVFENNIIKYVWNELPESSAFTVSCNLTSGSLLKGKQTITGEFVFNNGDQTEHVPIKPIIVDIIAPALDAENGLATPKVERKITTNSEKKGEYLVELTFFPNNMRDAAKFTDVLPENFSALIVDAHESSFSFENQSVIFSWKKFPKDKLFTISYLVRSSTPGIAPVINGTLVYGDAIVVSPLAVSQLPSSDNDTYSNSVVQETTTSNYEEPKQALPESKANSSENTFEIKTDNVATDITTTDEISEVSSDNVNKLITAEDINADITTEDEITETLTEEAGVGITTDNTDKDNSSVEISTGNAPANATTASIDKKTDVADAVNGISFRVQISATMKSPARSSEWFENKFDINPPVEMTYDSGWKKYLIGSFSAYDEAKEYKNQTREKISDAFIVAYQNGKRIPVSEAIRNKALNQ